MILPFLDSDHGGTSIIKVYTDRCAAGMGYTFQASKCMNGFHLKSIWMGYIFTQKVYEWIKFEK